VPEILSQNREQGNSSLLPEKINEAAMMPAKSGTFSSSFWKRGLRLGSQQNTPPTETSTPRRTAGLEVTRDSAGISTKKELPPEIKTHFEANSATFVSLAQKKEGTSSKEESTDPWDEAIMTGKYPGGRIPVQIEASVGQKSTQSIPLPPIPEKPKTKETPISFPSQVLDETEKIPSKEHDLSFEPIKIRRFIPRDAKASAGNQPETRSPFSVPKKPTPTPTSGQTAQENIDQMISNMNTAPKTT